jgi:putative tricarboxylic transport membrane protein
LTPPVDQRVRRRATIGLRVFGLAVCALGGVALFESTRIRSSVGFSPFGPTVMVITVGVLLLVTGVLFLIRLGPRPDHDLIDRVVEEEAATHWPTTGLMAGLLLVYALVLGVLGYVIATGLMIPSGARILGSRRLVRDAGIGFALAIVVYVAFTNFLGVRLPAGVLEPVLP